MKFTTEIEIRFADLDAYGHVNNAVFFTYLETARIKLFFERFREFLDSGLLFLVVRAECDYRKPIELREKVAVTLTPGDIGRSSFDLSYNLHDGNGTLYAEARTVMVCFDSKTGRTVPLPEAFRTALAPVP
jgi:acyl-CoA thioester hydrolase